MRYIVKNCPAYEEYLTSLDLDTLDSKVSDTNICLKRLGDNPHCQDCNDCPTKQVINLCKKQACIGIDCAWCYTNCNLELVKFAKSILEQFEIKEV